METQSVASAPRSIYGLANQKAKQWWWHQRLREDGKITEAREKERASIRSTIKTIRQASLMTVGNYGFTIYQYPERDTDGRVRSIGKISGHDSGEEYNQILMLTRPEVPYCDNRTVPEKHIYALTVNGPMAASYQEQADIIEEGKCWVGSHFAPIAIWLAIHEALGATVRWGAYEENVVAAFVRAGPTIDRLLVIINKE